MKPNKLQRLLAVIAGICMLFCQMASFTAFASEPEIILKDYTAYDLTTLEGEAKILVSIKNLEDSASIIQVALGFEGNMRYKGITFLKGEDNIPKCYRNYPNAALANVEKALLPGIISTTPLDLEPNDDGVSDLFILTFEKSKDISIDDSDVTVSVDSESTYYMKDLASSKKSLSAADSETANASDKKTSSKTAKVRIEMDKLPTFAWGANSSSEYAGSGINLKLTSENTPGYTVYTEINCANISNGGHKENLSEPTFTVTNTVLDDTYTVEISGAGFVTKKYTGVTFDDVLVITNADFVPGDLNGDGKVNSEDKKIAERAADDESFAESLSGMADFNRDGEVDDKDLVVYDNIIDDDNNTGSDNTDKEDGKDETKPAVPSQVEKPSLSAGDRNIIVYWKNPSDGGLPITKYTIKYGTKSSSLDKSIDITDVNQTEYTLVNLPDSTTYYIAVAASNKNGQGAFSEIASATTNAYSDNNNSGVVGGGGGGGGGSSSGGGGGGGSSSGGGGGGSSFGGGGGAIAPITGSTSSAETFADLSGYDWAKASIYELKNKGIISGTSDTTFSPANNIKRGDFILILTRMLNIVNEFDNNFEDVPVGSYYYNAIGSAKACGIATGDGVNFMPESTITRQDLITLAYRAFSSVGYIQESDASVLDTFGDKASIAPYAAGAMASMVNAGIIKGSDGNVNPLGNATRAEVAVMCARLAALIK